MVLMLGFNGLYGQTFASGLFDKIKKANDKPVLSYDYKVYLKNTDENRVEDSIVGHFYKDSLGYVDSNTFSISLVNNTHYCKVDISSKSVTVSTIEVLKQKLGLSPSDIVEPNIIALTDSMLTKQGTLSSRVLSNGNHEISVNFKNHDFSGFTAEIEKESLLLQKIVFEVEEKNKYGESAGYSRIYVIEDFQYDFDEKKLLTNRFFKQKQDKILLADKYARYHLYTITE